MSKKLTKHDIKIAKKLFWGELDNLTGKQIREMLERGESPHV